MYSLDKYIERIYNCSFLDTDEERIENLRPKKLSKYRIKTILSGDMLESDAYPIWSTIPQGVIAKSGGTPENQKKVNYRNLQKKIVRLLNGNFTNEDIWLTVGYRNGEEPKDAKEAKKDITNYIRNLREYCKKNNLEKLKYIFVTEYGEDIRTHHHIVMNFKDRDIAEKMWTKGEYPQSRRLQPNDYGLEGLARYLSKDPKGRKSYGYSKGLYKSWKHAKVSDNKMTKKRAERIATDKIDVKGYYEKLYPGFDFIDVEVRYSDFCGGCYLYARMRKKQHKKNNYNKENGNVRKVKKE